MSGSPVLKEQTFQREISAARQHWGAAPPGAFGGAPRGAQAPSLPGRATGYSTMTIGGTATATGVLILLVSISAAVGYSQVVQPELDRFGRVVGGLNVPPWVIIAGLVGFVFGLVSSFVPKAARFTAPLYALGYGLLVGAISALYNVQTQGVVLQAVMATMAVTAVMWFLFVSRIIKVTQRLRTIVMAATLGIFLMYAVAAIASLFGADLYFFRHPTALGIGVSVLIVGVAAFNLLLDFDFVEKAVAMGSPKYMEWYAGFGITVTLVWLYLELLRLLSMLNRR